MKPVKLAIIGCGLAARNLHWPALKKLKTKFVICVVCNHTEQKAKEYSRLVGNVPYCIDYKDVLRNPEIEAVDIALPIHLNYEVTKAAVEAGKHVIIEKPLAANLEEAKQMLVLDKKYPHLVKMVAENFRYHKVFLRIKEIIDTGRIGKPYSVLWHHLVHMKADNKYVHTQWRTNHKHSGGFITDGGVHNIAVIRMLFGEIVRGSAVYKSINPSIGKVDTLSLLFETVSGVHGVYNTYYSSNSYVNHLLIINGTRGTIENFGNKISVKSDVNKSFEERIDHTGGYKEEFLDFYNAICNNAIPKSTFDEAYKDLVVLLNALTNGNKLPEL